jgi:hypothetical protein
VAGRGLPRLPALGFPTPLDQKHGFNRCPLLDSLERSDGSGCYSVLDLEAPKGSVECVHQFRGPLLSSREHPSLPALLRSRHPIQRHRRLTRTHRGRSRYRGQMSRRWSTTRRRAATLRDSRDRLVPLIAISACRLAQREQTRRSRRSRTAVPAPYRAAISAGSGSVRCWQSLHQTINRTQAAAALPSVIGHRSTCAIPRLRGVTRRSASRP